MQVRLGFGLLAFALVLVGCEKTEEVKKNLAKQESQKNTVMVEVVLKNVRVVLENYHVKHNEYPESLEVLIEGGQLRKQDVVDPWGSPLSYQRPEPHQFTLKSLGPDKQEGTDDVSLKQL